MRDRSEHASAAHLQYDVFKNRRDLLCGKFESYRKTRRLSGIAKPFLILSSDDGLRPMTDGLASDIRKRGGTKVTTIHGATNHAWDSLRVRLYGEVITWLEALPK